MAAPLETRVARLEAMLGIAAEDDLGPIAAIVQDAAVAFGLRPVELTGPSRQRRAVQARCAAAWIAREVLPGVSLRQIARALGREDHATILHALRRAEVARRDDADFLLFTNRMLRQARERSTP